MKIATAEGNATIRKREVLRVKQARRAGYTPKTIINELSAEVVKFLAQSDFEEKR